MKTRRLRPGRRLVFEQLEGRALMTASGFDLLHHTIRGLRAQIQIPGIAGASAGKAAVINAILGGAGHEFVILAQKEVPNILAVAARFSSGRPQQFTVPGIVAKTPNLQSGYTGQPHDVLALTMGGAVLLKKKTIELAAIARGPYTTTPFPSVLVFALDRGAGSSLGPRFAARPAITPDALVTVNVGPNGHGNSAIITDLTTGLTQPLSPSHIQVRGPVVRVLLSANQVPSMGFTLSKYKFSLYTQLTPSSGFAETGSFLPEAAMIPIGVLPTVAPPIF
jgi:hypothetical protein